MRGGLDHQEDSKPLRDHVSQKLSFAQWLVNTVVTT
jgi:hypothetical protein